MFFRHANTLNLAAILVCISFASAEYPFFDENDKPGDITSASPRPEDWIVSAVTNWMAQLPHDTKLNDMSIPGTHDSGSLVGGPLFETQTWDITDQVRAGIRFFDIRSRRTGTSFAIHHGVKFQNIMFGNVLNSVKRFLLAHPQEVIIMRIKEEHDAMEGSENFQEIWDRYMKSFGSMFAPERRSIPTLGEIRGKVFVLRDASFRGKGMRYKSDKIIIQDKYKVWFLVVWDFGEDKDSATLPRKVQLVREYLDRANSSEKLVLNYLSGSTGMVPRHVAGFTNTAAYEHIGSYKEKKTLGVVIMDYPGEKLVYRIIKTNF